jgi:hypothetical protein
MWVEDDASVVSFAMSSSFLPSNAPTTVTYHRRTLASGDDPPAIGSRHLPAPSSSKPVSDLTRLWLPARGAPACRAPIVFQDRRYSRNAELRVRQSHHHYLSGVSGVGPSVRDWKQQGGVSA